jgi:hypothetical protein
MSRIVCLLVIAISIGYCTAFAADVDSLLRLEQNRLTAATVAAVPEAIASDTAPAAEAWTPEPGVLYAYG